VAAAHEEARQVRARTADRVLRAAEGEAEALLAEAEREAIAVRDRARSRTPALVDRVLALVLEDLTADEASTVPPGAHRAQDPASLHGGGS
jgi:regulator of protease activity HflC (stomatin/prohibitin superfamily)